MMIYSFTTEELVVLYFIHSSKCFIFFYNSLLSPPSLLQAPLSIQLFTNILPLKFTKTEAGHP